MPTTCRPWRRRSPPWRHRRLRAVAAGPRHLAVGLGATALWQGYMASALGGILVDGRASDRPARWRRHLWRDKRPPALIGARPPGSADRVGAQRPVRAWKSDVALGEPGALARPRRRQRSHLVARLARPDRRSQGVAKFLQDNRGKSRFPACRPNALLAAPVIVRTGQPVMAFGGFFGTDPVMASIPSPGSSSAARCVTPF